MALGPLMVLTILVIAYVIASIFLPLLTGGAGYTPTPRRAVDEAR